MRGDEFRLFGKLDDWYSVINTDIKPKNVVLADPDSSYPYPTPKMIDLGLAWRARPPEPHDALFDFESMEKLTGTMGWQPPVR